MSERRLLPALLVFLAAAVVAGCEIATDPGRNASPPTSVSTDIQSPGGNPDFLTLAAGAPPLADTVLSFYAIKGTKAEVFMYYHAQPGQTDSSKFLRFRLDRRSLCNRPNGSPIPRGDSLLITITIIDPAKQIVQFEPSGLQFCTGREAKLNLWYAEDDHDFDMDGDIDRRDRYVERHLQIWRQESATQPWVRLMGVLMQDLDEIEVEIPGFTNYVVAY
ncbi:MAG: hypothetical protein ABI877_08880 [Gemmatimonadaceae bacterium]